MSQDASNPSGLAPVPDRKFVEELVRQVVLKRFGQPSRGPAPVLAVHASARHTHLSRTDLDRLFGSGYELTIDRQLYQEGNYAAKETVTLIGPRSRLISNLRILGPLRGQTQVELAFTDAISLGLDIPIRLSGDIKGTPGAFSDGAEGDDRVAGGRDSRGHSCPHESGRGGVVRRETRRPHEATRGWRCRP